MISYIRDGKIEIKRQKAATAKLLIFSAVFALIFFYMGFFMDLDEHGRLGAMISTDLGGFLFRVVMLAGAVIYGAAFLLFLRQKGKPLLTADENGITHNSPTASAGVNVHWDNIKRIYIGVYKNQKFIEMELNDTENFLRVLPESKRRNAAAYMNLGHQPVCITFVGTNVKPEDVLPDLIRLWEKYNGISLLSE